MIQPHQDSSTSSTTTVVIVGGGVAGLFLANALEQQGISYKLLETGKTIAPQLGASIGLLPHGLRLLDQINVLAEVEKHQYGHKGWEHRDGTTGELLSHLTVLARYREETGYGVFFLERRQLLQILYDNIKDKSAILVDRKVCRIDHFDDHASVYTRHDEQFSCQLVVGADGVHSAVRQEIEKTSEPGSNGEEYLNTRFSCIYGISNPVPLLETGMNYSCYRQGASCLVFTGLAGVTYWFVFGDIGRVATYDPARHLRFSAADQDALVKEVLHCKVTNGVTFKDILAECRTALMTPLEEGVVKRWYGRRMVLVGDSAHKMVPHAAMGGNLAIESASTLMNSLLNIRDAAPDKSLDQIPLRVLNDTLQKYADNRQDRAEKIVGFAQTVCRDQLCLNDNYRDKIAGLNDAGWLSANLVAFSGSEKMRTMTPDTPRVKFYSERARQVQELLRTGAPVVPVGVETTASA